MAAKPLPDQATLLKLLRYDPLTGRLFWLPREASDFGDHRRAEALAKQFNSSWAGSEAFTADNSGYRVGTLNGIAMRAHRVIWCMMFGYWSDHIDHRDQDRANNRLVNLADAGRVANARNSRLSSRNRSGRIGVNWAAQRRQWRSKIRHDGRYIELGYFQSFEEACAVRQAAEKQYGYSALHGKKKAR